MDIIEETGHIDSDDEQVHLTAAEVIEAMEETWINEKFAPEILPHKSEIVDCLLGQISYMEDNLQNLTSKDFRKSAHQLEIDRLRFLITNYMRTRLEKIEKFVLNILKEEQLRIDQGDDLYLTEQELKFAKDYSQSK